MLDVDIITPAQAVATDVVSLADMKKHLRISSTNTSLDDVITSVINDAVDKLGGIGGELNRTILPVTLKRYMSVFPRPKRHQWHRDRGPFPWGNDQRSKTPIQLPFPPLISVDAITIEDGSSPPNVVDPSTYVVKTGMLVPEIHPLVEWPYVERAPRAISVTYKAGYDDGYPPQLARMVKFLAAHYFENAEATVTISRRTSTSQAIQFALGDLRASLTVPISYDDWNE